MTKYTMTVHGMVSHGIISHDDKEVLWHREEVFHTLNSTLYDTDYNDLESTVAR